MATHQQDENEKNKRKSDGHSWQRDQQDENEQLDEDKERGRLETALRGRERFMRGSSTDMFSELGARQEHEQWDWRSSRSPRRHSTTSVDDFDWRRELRVRDRLRASLRAARVWGVLPRNN